MTNDAYIARMRRRLSDSSSDSLSHGQRSIAMVLFDGVTHASPGAVFVATVCIAIGLVAALGRL